MCFIINILQNAMHDDILSRGGGGQGGGGAHTCPKIIIQTFHCREKCQ